MHINAQSHRCERAANTARATRRILKRTRVIVWRRCSPVVQGSLDGANRCDEWRQRLHYAFKTRHCDPWRRAASLACTVPDVLKSKRTKPALPKRPIQFPWVVTSSPMKRPDHEMGGNGSTGAPTATGVAEARRVTTFIPGARSITHTPQRPAAGRASSAKGPRRASKRGEGADCPFTSRGGAVAAREEESQPTRASKTRESSRRPPPWQPTGRVTSISDAEDTTTATVTGPCGVGTEPDSPPLEAIASERWGETRTDA